MQDARDENANRQGVAADDEVPAMKYAVQMAENDHARENTKLKRISHMTKGFWVPPAPEREK